MTRYLWLMVGLFLVGAIAIYAATSPNTPRAKIRAEVEQVQADCKVIGDAADYNKTQGHFMRTIYRCPDGTIKIR